MMVVKTRCPHCGKAFSLQASYLGKRFKCSGCGKKSDATALEKGGGEAEALFTSRMFVDEK